MERQRMIDGGFQQKKSAESWEIAPGFWIFVTSALLAILAVWTAFAGMVVTHYTSTFELCGPMREDAVLHNLTRMSSLRMSEINHGGTGYTPGFLVQWYGGVGNLILENMGGAGAAFQMGMSGTLQLPLGGLLSCVPMGKDKCELPRLGMASYYTIHDSTTNAPVTRASIQSLLKVQLSNSSDYQTVEKSLSALRRSYNYATIQDRTAFHELKTSGVLTVLDDDDEHVHQPLHLNIDDYASHNVNGWYYTQTRLQVKTPICSWGSQNPLLLLMQKGDNFAATMNAFAAVSD